MCTIFHKITRLFPCRRKRRSENRTVFIGKRIPPTVDASVIERFPSNCVISSKYTAWNFVPKNLFEQFHRIANIYFLVVAVILSFVETSISPWTSILPLIFVVLVTSIKQGYEDWLRHKADHEVNWRQSLVVRNGQLEEVRAADVQVGDIVKVLVNCDIPCDLVLFSSSEPCGNCYITTANLDGETNLKTFYSTAETQQLTTEHQLQNLIGSVECEQPTTDFYRFVGRINVYKSGDCSNNNAPPVTRSLGPGNILLRGTRLKNTRFVYGCSIYTGKETKVSLNSKYKAHKYSQVEKKMNRYLVVYIFVLVSFAIIWVVITFWFYSSSRNDMWYINDSSTDFWSMSSGHKVRYAIENFLCYVILCNYIIPISMYVTVELQKFFGSIFFEWDIDMYDVRSNEPAKAKTSDLNEELGQVEYLFSDKTGTLTENDMKFRQCSVGGRLYEEVGNQLYMKSDVRTFPVRSLSPELEELFTVLALCHTVRVDSTTDGETRDREENDVCPYDYQSSSPDEKALVEACHRFGIIFHGIKDGLLELSVKNVRRHYTLHDVLEFDSNRKRMSVIVENEDGDIFLHCKGAETAIFERVCKSSRNDVELVEGHVNGFAMLGLRTLVIATRNLTAEEFKRYHHILHEAKTDLDDREEKLAQAYEIVESDLRLLGATAVEDKLQEGVVETICDLREAGIKVWVLTGDKEETAVNVSYSAGHFNHEMEPLSLTRQGTIEDCGTALSNFSSLVEEYKSRGQQRHALVIDGKSLTLALEGFPDLLRDTCENCLAVLCCRMTPIQKAQVVRLVKNGKKKPITAAVGDGANDVSMIQEADVGLGIMGKEGRQAVRFSDYAFARFCFLRKALLVHGHYFYRRIAILVQYFFYKNVAMITSQLYFTFFSAFSAQTLFNGYYLMFFNMTFTALPIMIFSLFEQHLTSKQLLNCPSLYKKIRKNNLLSNWNFLKWNLLALWQSLVFFFGTFFAFAPGNSPYYSGHGYGVYEMGTVVMTACVLTVNIKLMLETYNFNLIMVAGFVLSFAAYFVTTPIYCLLLWPFFKDTLVMYGSFQTILSSVYVWCVLLLLTVTALLPDIILRTVHDNLGPFHGDVKRSIENNNTLSERRLKSTDQSPIRRVEASAAAQSRPSNDVPTHSRRVPSSNPSRRWHPGSSLDESPSARAMAVMSSASSRRRLLSTTSSDGSPVSSDFGPTSPLLLASNSRVSQSPSGGGSYATTFSETPSQCTPSSSSSSSRRLLF